MSRLKTSGVHCEYEPSFSLLSGFSDYMILNPDTKNNCAGKEINSNNCSESNSKNKKVRGEGLKIFFSKSLDAFLIRQQS